MKMLVRTDLRSGSHTWALFASRAFDSLVQAYLCSVGAIEHYVIEYRRAKVAHQLYQHLSGLSGAELAKRDLAPGATPAIRQKSALPSSGQVPN